MEPNVKFLCNSKCPSTLSDSATVAVTVTGKRVTGKSGVRTQPILSITVPVKKIKGAVNHRYDDADGIDPCELGLKVLIPPR